MGTLLRLGSNASTQPEENIKSLKRNEQFVWCHQVIRLPLQYHFNSLRPGCQIRDWESSVVEDDDVGLSETCFLVKI